MLKIQQCKLASRNSYKMLAKRLFELYSISGMTTICVCVSAPEASNNQWHDTDPI